MSTLPALYVSTGDISRSEILPLPPDRVLLVDVVTDGPALKLEKPPNPPPPPNLVAVVMLLDDPNVKSNSGDLGAGRLKMEAVDEDETAWPKGLPLGAKLNIPPGFDAA